MGKHPVVHWIESGEERFARWRSESGAPPPRRVVIADDYITADDAYGPTFARIDRRACRAVQTQLERPFAGGEHPRCQRVSAFLRVDDVTARLGNAYEKSSGGVRSGRRVSGADGGACHRPPRPVGDDPREGSAVVVCHHADEDDVAFVALEAVGVTATKPALLILLRSELVEELFIDVLRLSATAALPPTITD